MARMSTMACVAMAALAVALPAAAQEAAAYKMVAPELRLTPVRAFGDAAPFMQFVMAGLIVSAVGAVVVWAMQVRVAQPRTTYLQGLAATAPVVGLMGGVLVLMNGFLGISNIRPAPTLTVVAPGIVEALLSVGLGLFAAVVALICRWQLEGRISRARTA
jgi:hypothetical protein